MGVVIPVGFGQAKVRWSLAGDPEEQIITFGFDMLAGQAPSTSASQIHAANVAAGLTTGAGMQAGWTYQGVDTTWMDASGPIGYRHQAATAGTNAGTGLPSNCAIVVQKFTALGGRRNRGRVFLPACYAYEGSIDQLGLLTSGQQAALQGLMSGWIGALAAANIRMQLLHSDGGVPTPVLTLGVERLIGTQRKRMRR